MTLTKKKILVISNGEAEDAIACSIIQHLKTDDIDIIAAPLVSHGNAYLKHNIPICCPTASLPSYGFNNQSLSALKQDFQAGLGTLLFKQFRSIRRIRHDIKCVIACGDIVPQMMAVFTGKPYISIFTALSEFYVRDHVHHFKPLRHRLEQSFNIKHSVFPAFDRHFMKRKQCKGVFVRDQLTNDVLRKFNINSYFTGNPMMDNLAETQSFPMFNPLLKTLLLLPGSRSPEALSNLNRMVDVLHHLKHPYNIAVSLAPNLDLQQCQDIVKRSPLPVHLLKGSFSALLNHAHVALSMCGTGAEQAVGKGLAVISIPGEGPQFSYKFAEAQQRLLGQNYFLVTESNSIAAQRIEKQLHLEPSKQFKSNGLQRMGSPGGSQRIAAKTRDLLQLNSSTFYRADQVENTL